MKVVTGIYHSASVKSKKKKNFVFQQVPNTSFFVLFSLLGLVTLHYTNHSTQQHVDSSTMRVLFFCVVLIAGQMNLSPQHGILLIFIL